MNKTSNLLYLCVMVLRCLWGFHSVHGIQQIPVNLYYKGKYTSDIKNYEIVFPQRVNKDGSFISHLVQHRHSKRSTTDKEYVFYKIPIGGKDYLIELTPNRKLIAPGAVVEIRKADTKKSSKRKVFSDINPNDTLREMFENLEIRKLENTECHFSGHVKGENISKAALSTCYGLAGFIQIKNGFYTIEPVAEHDPSAEDSYPHILYKEDGLENSSTCHTIRDMATALLDQVVRKRRESYMGSSSPMFAETLIVMDKTMVNHHRESDCENYVLTVFNMAHNLFRDASVGMLMTLTVVRLIRLEIEDDEMNLKVDEDAEKTLKYFQTWQYEINPGDDSHPNHHDLALLLTRVNVCSSPTPCRILGLTTIGKACDPKQSAALCEDSGLRLGYVIAHEIGHLLGADHDTENSTCRGTLEGGLKTIMHPQVSLESKTWSKCSQDYFKEFFKTTENCFLDEPEEHHYNLQDLLPGVMYNADFQCRYLFTSKSRECEMGSTCTSLNCYIPGYACIVTHMEPADGTRCGESMWCHNSNCLVVGERPGAVDGSWGEWSAWSDCSRTCGAGVANSVRNCDRPQPAHGGRNCVGERKRYKICAATITTVPQNISDLIRFISEEVNVSFVGKPCETGRPSFRDIQCGEFNDWIYPEDGKIHSWKAHYFHEDNPCILYCINEEKVVAALRPRVMDGTTCYRGVRDVCIAGNCKNLPCDLQFGSNAIEDACGVCHGDGTACEFTQGIRSLPKLTQGLTKLLNIPAGTKNIKVEEISPTLARIFVRDKDTKDIYGKGKNLGVFSVPGSQAWLGMINKNQETLHIPGPVTKPLSIWVNRLENVTIKWSMALPAEQQRKPEFAWDFLKWEPCSAECGPGIQKSDPSCMEEKAGLVEDTFCSDLQIPAAKVRPCEIEKCTARWMVGDWKYCDNTNSQEKERKRIVYCIKKIGEGEGESQIVPDSECKEPKPHSKEPCEKRQKREDTEYNKEEGSSYKSDTFEFALHKKYDDYLKHFSALSVPQKKSETIPFHLVSSPHFRHYFHVLETPEDNSEDSEKVADLNINSADNITDHFENKISSDFYKDTFSGQQIDVSHFANKLSMKERKSVFFNSPKGKKGRKKNVLEKDGKLQKIDQNRHERDSKRSIRRRSGHSQQLPIYLTKLLPSKKPVIRRYLDDKSNGISTTNSVISDTMRKLFPRVRETRHISPQMKHRKSPGEMPNWKYSYLGRPPKLMREKFLSKNSDERLRKEKRKSSSKRRDLKKLKNGMLIRKLNKEWDRTPDLFRRIKKYDMHTGNSKKKKLSPKFFVEGYKSRNHKKRFKDLLLDRKNFQNQFKRSFQGEKRNPYSISKGKLNKTKRSNRKRKKSKLKDISAKLSKESIGNVYGIETKNYLNNLFRENRPRATTFKPQRTIQSLKKPMIHAGKVIIDRDSVEDKQLDILFQDEDGEEKFERNSQLPRPPVNENRLCLKNQQVFDLIQTLQRRSCYYRPNSDPENKSKLEIGVNLSKAALNEKRKAGPVVAITEAATKSESAGITSVLDCYDEALESFSKQKMNLPSLKKMLIPKKNSSTTQLDFREMGKTEDMRTIFVAIQSGSTKITTALPPWTQSSKTTTLPPWMQYQGKTLPPWMQAQKATIPIWVQSPRTLPSWAQFQMSTTLSICADSPIATPATITTTTTTTTTIAPATTTTAKAATTTAQSGATTASQAAGATTTAQAGATTTAQAGATTTAQAGAATTAKAAGATTAQATTTAQSASTTLSICVQTSATTTPTAAAAATTITTNTTTTTTNTTTTTTTTAAAATTTTNTTTTTTSLSPHGEQSSKTTSSSTGAQHQETASSSTLTACPTTTTPPPLPACEESPVGTSLQTWAQSANIAPPPCSEWKTNTEDTNINTNISTENETEAEREVCEENSECEKNYDIDEIIPYPSEVEISTEQETKGMKREKKKKKFKEEMEMERERKKKVKGKGPYLEDYQVDLEAQDQNASLSKPVSFNDECN